MLWADDGVLTEVCGICLEDRTRCDHCGDCLLCCACPADCLEDRTRCDHCGDCLLCCACPADGMDR